MLDGVVVLAKFSAEGWMNGMFIGGLIGAAIGIVYKVCMGGVGRQS